ncbi:MAG: AIR carboxylase family protein, partial [Actinomycetota bacterium]|nr:AIR carboxylase family protein [Actinomycetota bacterium]
MSPSVGILVGSKSDLPILEKCTARLDDLDVDYELEVRSAHRT